MKNYILKLLTEDLEVNENRLCRWHEMDNKYKEDDYQVKRMKALENKIKKTKRYIERVLIEVK